MPIVINIKSPNDHPKLPISPILEMFQACFHARQKKSVEIQRIELDVFN